jgi:hypothetical protein
MKRAVSIGLALGILALQISVATAAGVRPLYDLSQTTASPFPSDRFAVRDATQITGLRVNLPKQDCAVRVSDCEDIDLLNELDGFSITPRLSIPFSGPIDVSTVTSQTVFLMKLDRRPGHGERIVGIEQIVWDVATNTLHVVPAEQLEQHTRYALIVTRGVRDAAGDPIEPATPFRDLPRDPNLGGSGNPELLRYAVTVVGAVVRIVAARVADPRRIASVSVFTSRSITPTYVKFRDHVMAAPAPPPADFLLGPNGARTVYTLEDITTATFGRQTRADAASPLSPLSLDSRLALLRLVPGAVGHVAFGRYRSPNYLRPDSYMPPFGTASGTPSLLGTNDIYFNLFLPADTPATPRPAGGWPVVIFIPGSPDNKNGGPFNVAAGLAAQGLASISITPAGLGFGPLSTLTVVSKTSGPATFLAGGRSSDQNGDGAIDAGEGIQAPPPRRTLRTNHTIRQTVVDLIQLLRVIEIGVDVDGDGRADLDASRMYFMGFSFGPNVGGPLLAVEPRLRANVLAVPGAGLRYGRLSAANRAGLGNFLLARTPSLINANGLTSIGGVAVPPPHFNENMPQEDEPALVNTVPGATEIQEVIFRTDWLAHGPSAFASYLRRAPLPGIPARPLLIQFGKGDYTIPTNNTAGFLEAGDLADRATFYRHDRAFAADPTRMKDPHTFLIRTDTANMRTIALAAQRQIATFLASNGVEMIDPDEGAADLFEVPISPQSLESIHDLAYIP